MSKKIRGIKIDTVKQEVYEVEIQESIDGLKPIYDLLECSIVEIVRINGAPNGTVIFVDEEGLVADQELGGFTIAGFPNILSGHGLLVGTKMGKDGTENDSLDKSMTVEGVRQNVKFIDKEKMSQLINR